MLSSRFSKRRKLVVSWSDEIFWVDGEMDKSDVELLGQKVCEDFKRKFGIKLGSTSWDGSEDDCEEELFGKWTWTYEIEHLKTKNNLYQDEIICILLCQMDNQ